MKKTEELIAVALRHTTDTRACVVAPHAVEAVVALFKDLFPHAQKALVVADPRTYKVAGLRVMTLLKAAGITVDLHLLAADGRPFHATYAGVEEVRSALTADAVPIAVGSGTINDLVKRASEERGLRYMVVGTAASMDGYTSYGASITKDGIKQTLPCKAPLGCIVDAAVAAGAPKEMVASGYADLLAKIPAGADWILADTIGSEAIHHVAWHLVQDTLREALANPAGAASGDVAETEKLCLGLVMSGFAMQAMNSSRPASGTEHQLSHYWDMEDLSVNGLPVSHGFKVGIGTLVSTKTLEFILRQDLAHLDVEACAKAWWPTWTDLEATFPKVYGNRPAHIRRAQTEMAHKYVTPEQLRGELTILKNAWPTIRPALEKQLMPFQAVYDNLRQAGAPYEPEMIGVTRERLRETLQGVTYMRNRYFGLDLVARLGLLPALTNELFGTNGIWEVK